MSDPYIVARYGDEWFVVHVPTKTVTARCDNKYAAEGIAHHGNEATALRWVLEQGRTRDEA